jgi:hypothetical protein
MKGTPVETTTPTLADLLERRLGTRFAQEALDILNDPNNREAVTNFYQRRIMNNVHHRQT